MFSLPSEFWAAILGSIVGGLMSFAILMIERRAAKTDRDRERLLSDQARARALIFKIGEIGAGLKAYADHISDCKAAAETDGNEFGWPYLLPTANTPRTPFFTADEMSLLLACGRDDLFNRMINLDRFFEVNVQAFAKYTRKREETLEHLPAKNMQGNKGDIVLEGEKADLYRPKFANLDDLARGIVASIEQDTDGLEDLIAQVIGVLNEKYMLKLKITVHGAQPLAPK